MAAAIAPTHSVTVPRVVQAPYRQRSRRRLPVVVAPSISVVIVNYCQWRNTARLTRQLRRSHVARAGEAEIVVVDNHSPGHPLLAKLRRTPGVSVRRFERNRGFAPAVNAGCQRSRGEWILLLNPDVSVPTGFLDDLDLFVHRQERADPRVGIIGLAVRNTDGSAQASCGPLPTLARTLTGLLLPRAQRKCRPIETDRQTPVAWATGCALLIRRDCFEEIAGFDEDFFLYYEDVDLCRRAAERGWKVCFEPTLRVRHHSPLHSRPTPAPLRLMTRHALLTYGLKHWPRWQALALGGIIGVESLARQAAAWWGGRAAEADFHAQTRRLMLEMLTGQARQARDRIARAAEGLETVAAAQDARKC